MAMVKCYEVHVVTYKNISDIEKSLQSTGLKIEKELVKKGILYIASGNSITVKIMIELYEKKDNEFEYEFKFNDFDDMKYMHDFLENL